jgi:hypothetical protein
MPSSFVAAPRALAAAALLLTAPPTALADAHWLCGLSDDAVRLVCVADAAPQAGASQPDGADVAEAAAAPPKVTAVVNGTTFPLDTRRQYVVDLWTPPSDMAFVEQLARATICYRSPGCAVTFVEARDAMAAPRASTLARRR